MAKKDAWAAAAAYGVNMKLLEERLRMTPAERVRENQRVLDMVDEFRVVARGVLERARRLRRSVRAVRTMKGYSFSPSRRRR